MGNKHCDTPIRDWSGCTACRLHSTRRSVVVRKQCIVHVPNKSFLPCNHPNLKAAGIHDINPLPPGKEHLATWYLQHKNLYIPPPNTPPNTLTFPHILIVGMAPGESEDLHGRPFVGISGNILNSMLSYAFSTFLMTCTNTVCCRPSHNKETTADYSKWGKNRDPELAEMEHCRPHIDELLLSYKFSGILTLGELATNHMRSFKHKLPTLALYHPAYIARLAFKLYTIRTEALKLKKWLKTL